MIAAVSVVVAGVRWFGSSSTVDRAGHVKEPDVTAPAGAPLAVVIAYPGTEVWIGNDIYTDAPAPPDPDTPRDPEAILVIRHRFHGAHAAMIQGFDDLARALPAASRVGVLAYDIAQQDVRQTLAPATDLDGSRIVGPQERYHEHIGSARHEDVLDRAALLVRAVPATRHVIVLLTDSCHTANPRGLVAARDRLAADGIQVRVIFLDTVGINAFGGVDCNLPLRALDPTVLRPKGVSDLPQAMRSALGV
jgi:hypothetical protein